MEKSGRRAIMKIIKQSPKSYTVELTPFELKIVKDFLNNCPSSKYIPDDDTKKKINQFVDRVYDNTPFQTPDEILDAYNNRKISSSVMAELLRKTNQ